MQKTLLFTLFLTFMSISIPLVLALSYSSTSDEHFYTVNESITYQGFVDRNLSVNVTVSIINSSGYTFNHTIFNASYVNFTTHLNATVNHSGDYIIRTNFTYNSTVYQSDIDVKISKAEKIIIASDKSVYSPNETVNFTVRALDKNDVGVTGESVTVKLIYLANDTILGTRSGTTDASGEYSSTFTAPGNVSSYRLIANDGIAVKVFDVSNFDLIAFSGDSNTNAKTRYGIGETVLLFADLFSTNKTKYTGTESIAYNITYPNGTRAAITLTYSGTRLNTSIALNQNGTYNIKVSVLSTGKFVEFNFPVENYELRVELQNPERGETSVYFPNDSVDIIVKVYNTTSGELVKTSVPGTWDLSFLDATNRKVLNISNTSTRLIDGSFKFSFSAPANVSGLHFIEIKFNTTDILTDIRVQQFLAESIPVDSAYSFQDVFLGGKSTVRILTSLSNVSGIVNVTNITVVDVRNSQGVSVKSRLIINTSLVNFKSGKAGLVEFPAPGEASFYYIKTIANNDNAAESWFLVKTMSVCSRLSGYKWFVGPSDNVGLIVRVTATQDTSLIESFGGTSSKHGGEVESISHGSTSFGNMYGTMSCTGGNASSNVQVSVKKIFNTFTMEDVTSKVTIQSNRTDTSGEALVNISKPANGWDGGFYVVQFDLRDEKNNTDTGFGSFKVQQLWINVWPKQNSGTGGSFWKWYFDSNERLKFDVYAYNSTGTWGWYGQNLGVGDNCYLENVLFMGSYGEWFWPPKTFNSTLFNYTCSKTNNGIFNLTIDHNVSLASGQYMMRVKVNTTGGVSDVGEGWFTVKAYNVYVKSNSANWYDTWYKGATENITFRVDVTYPNSTEWQCSWSTCNGRVNQTLNFTVKGMTKYDKYVPGDYSKTKFNATVYNGTVEQLWSLNRTNTSTGGGTSNITFIPKGGVNKNSWESGYYSAIIEVTGPDGSRETGSAWFEVRSFFVDAIPVKASGGSWIQTWTFNSTGNITINVSASSRPSWYKNAYSANASSVNATIVGLKIYRYSYSDWQTINVSISDYNPKVVNGTTLINISSSSLDGGSYNLEITLKDDNGNEQTAWAWFEVKDFSFTVRTANWKWEFTPNQTIVLDVAACDGETWWCDYDSNSYSGATVNFTVSKLFKSTTWPYTEVTTWTSARNQSGTAGKAQLIITPNPKLSTGDYSAEVTARYASGSGGAQTRSAWFRISGFSVFVQSNKWEFGLNENVTLNITSNTALTIGGLKFSCGYGSDSTWYNLNENVGVNSTSITSGKNTIALYPLSGKFKQGSCWGSIIFTDPSDSSVTQESSIYFSIRAFSITVSLNKYDFNKTEGVLLTITTSNSVNISNILLNSWDIDGQKTFKLNSSTSVNTTFGNVTLNRTSLSGLSSYLINMTPQPQWNFGSHYGEINFIDQTDATINQTQWIYFNVPFPVQGWGSVVNSAGNWIYGIPNTTAASRNITIKVYASRYNHSLGYYQNVKDINVSILKVVQEDCTSYPCARTTLTDVTVQNSTTDNSGIAYVNITRTSNWAERGHTAQLQLNDTITREVVNNSAAWFWVWTG